VLKKLGLDTKYVGNTNVNGEDYSVTPIDGDRRPFKAFLDVGLRKTSTGSKIFAAMKVHSSIRRKKKKGGGEGGRVRGRTEQSLLDILFFYFLAKCFFIRVPLMVV
jgi:hypothetical protein